MDLASLQVFQAVVRERSFSRAAEKLYPHAARREHLDSQARGVGRPASIRSRLGRADADGRGHAARRIRGPDAESARGNWQGHEGTARPRARPGFARRERKLDPRAASGARRDIGSFIPGIHDRVHRVFSRDVPREVMNHHLDIGVISYLAGRARARDARILPRLARAGRLARASPREAARSGYQRSGTGNLRRAHRGIALPAARGADVRALSRPPADGRGAADDRKHQAYSWK